MGRGPPVSEPLEAVENSPAPSLWLAALPGPPRFGLLKTSNKSSLLSEHTHSFTASMLWTTQVILIRKYLALHFQNPLNKEIRANKTRNSVLGSLGTGNLTDYWTLTGGNNLNLDCENRLNAEQAI